MRRNVRYPDVNDLIEFTVDTGYEQFTRTGTVRDLLASQFTVVWESSRPDGGWTEHTHFLFYRDHGVTWTFGE